MQVKIEILLFICCRTSRSSNTIENTLMTVMSMRFRFIEFIIFKDKTIILQMQVKIEILLFICCRTSRSSNTIENTLMTVMSMRFRFIEFIIFKDKTIIFYPT